jgi:curved DNA-binding protein CbpA
MDANKDYYATLGLTPSADPVVIRAAFKALAQRYHPDRTGVGQAQAGARMAEINEAYSVLSDPAKRTEYDRLRQNTARNADTAFQDGDAEPAAGSPLDGDWQTALQFYPELDALRAGLGKISWKLAEGFRARILGTKEFKDAQSLAARLEHEFLSVYFGSNPAILEFARILIRNGRRDAARDLNRALNVLGADTDPGRVIEVIRKKHSLSRPDDVFRWVDGAKRRGIPATRYARECGLDAEQVISATQRGVLPAFALDGILYIEIDEYGNPLRPHGSADTVNSGSSSTLPALVVIVVVIAIALIFSAALTH